MRYKTDLVIEDVEMCRAEIASLGENHPKAHDFNDGVKIDECNYGEGISSTTIDIINDKGERLLGKPQGKYITLEIKGLDQCEIVTEGGGSSLKHRAVEALATELRKMLSFHYYLKVLVVGLGNDKVTPDALGPYTASKVRITRHLFIMFEADGDEQQACVSGFIPGVMASTGMETADLIEKAVALTGPEVVIVIDSLAARNIERISTTIQINDTGISPGAGMGNNRKLLNKETLGKRVIAIGVPTVIDSSTLILDALEGYIADPEKVAEYISQKGQDMIVTSTDIDQVIKDFSDIIAAAINKVLHPGIYF